MGREREREKEREAGGEGERVRERGRERGREGARERETEGITRCTASGGAEPPPWLSPPQRALRRIRVARRTLRRRLP